MVTGAFAEPIAMSGKDAGFATCAARALCARAGTAGAKAPSATRARQRRGNNWRRVVNEISGSDGNLGPTLGCGGDKDHGPNRRHRVALAKAGWRTTRGMRPCPAAAKGLTVIR